MLRTCLFFLFLSLYACSQARNTGTDLIALTINAKKECVPMEWRIPAGRIITLTMTNEAGEDFSWIFMGRPVTPPFDGSDEGNVIYAHSIPPGKVETVQFKSPAAAGQYQVICSPVVNSDLDQSGFILVVQP
jgi:hypothetical protein